MRNSSTDSMVCDSGAIKAASPPVAVRWEQEIPRRRVRMWTVDDEVMNGWSAQVAPEEGPSAQGKLWNWIKENVDFRVRRRLI